MFDTPVNSLMRDVLVAAPTTTVAKAAQLMADQNVGAVLVVDGERLLGIFTERDVVFRVVAKGLDPAVARLSDVMTREPATIEPEAPFGYALILMQEKGFRHLPVLSGGRPVGIVSSRSAMDPELQEFRSETFRRDYWRRKGKPVTRA